jgi:hypothetical protein
MYTVCHLCAMILHMILRSIMHTLYFIFTLSRRGPYDGRTKILTWGTRSVSRTDQIKHRFSKLSDGAAICKIFLELANVMGNPFIAWADDS